MRPPLPPGVYPRTFTYANGRTETIYRAPFASEGPVARDERGQQVLYYMYAHYVFRWPRDGRLVDVGHGSIANHISVWCGVLIAGPWQPRTLVDFAQRWTREQFRG